MKRFAIHGALALWCVPALLLTGCNGTNTGPVKHAITLPPIEKIQDQTGVNDAIIYIEKNPSLWTQNYHSELATKINSLEAINRINNKDLYLVNLLNASCGALFQRTDAEFRRHDYPNYKQLKLDMTFLMERVKWLYQCGVYDASNAKLNDTKELFDNYTKLLALSEKTFNMTPSWPNDYSVNYHDTERQIKSNKFWNSHFSKNDKINAGMRAFPSRQAVAMKKYYDGLEQVLETKIRRGDFDTRTEARDALSKLDRMAQGSGSDAAARLNTFIKDYGEFPAERREREAKCNN